jgi:PAS domain S-box-containing protein
VNAPDESTEGGSAPRVRRDGPVDLTTADRAEHDAQRVADRMRAVAAAAAGVLGARTHEDLRAVLEAACRDVVPFDAFFILAYNAATHSFAGFGGNDAGVYSPPDRMPADGTPGEWVVRERRTLVTLRSTDPAATGARLTGTGRRSESIIRTPILDGDRVIGIFSVQSYTPDLYSQEDVEVVEALASLAATALANIRLFNERRAVENALRAAQCDAQRTADRMRAVAAAAAGVLGAHSLEGLQSVLIDACRQVVPFDAFTFGLYDAARHRLRYLQGWDAGVFVDAEEVDAAGLPSEWVIRERRSLLVLRSDDPRGHGAILTGTGRRSESVIRTPILSGDDVLGVLALHSYTPDLYAQQDVEVLEVIASLAATAMHNIRLAEARQTAENALRASEASYRALFDSSNDAIYVHDIETGRVLDVNAKTCELHGYDIDTFLERGLEIIDTGVWPFTAENAAGYMRRAAAGEPQVFEWLARHRGGNLFWLEVKLQRVLINGKERLLANARDIDDRKRAEEALQRSYAELERRVDERTTELERANRALRAAKEEAERAREVAEAANRAKSEFLSRMSHELRTPMNSILGFGQLLARKDLPIEQRRAVDHILKAGQHLLSLINEVLDLARIEANRQQLSPEPVPLDAALQEAISLIRPLATQQGCRVEEVEADPAVHVLADRQRLAQVLLNLLSNAVKYNRPDGHVRVTWGTPDGRPDRVFIAVHDTGAGIPAERMSELFTPFSRLGAEATGVEGTGLGLALSRRLIEAMNGTLTAESTFGAGSVFTIELERAGAPVDRLDWTAVSEQAGRVEAGEPATLLYIEDNLANLTLVEAILMMRPAITLIPALQGRMGIDLAREHRPDLILLDVNLPDLSGLEVLERLHADARTRDMPVVVISADATPDNVRALLDAGAMAYMTKPLEVEQFLRLVDGVLARRPGEPT